MLAVNSTGEEASANKNSRFFDVVTRITNQLPAFSDAGLMGYYLVNPIVGPESPYSSGTTGGSGSSSTPVNASGVPLSLAVMFYAIDTPALTLEPVIGPLISELKSLPDSLKTSNQTFSLPSFRTIQSSAFAAGSVGLNALLASRLWDKAAVGDPGVKEAIRTVAGVSGSFQGLFVSGPGVRAAPPSSAAVTPAWRKSYVHALGATAWAFGGDADAAVGRLSDTMEKALRSVAPNSGAYLNEANPFVSDWAHSFWGENYARLLDIKSRIDPRGVFWCPICVGTEKWNQDRQSGRICKVKTNN